MEFDFVGVLGTTAAAGPGNYLYLLSLASH
jgi:hypothetical protein